MAHRTFLALPLDEGVVARLVEAQQTLTAAGGHVRWVGPENLHLTVKFLGDVDDRDIVEVCRLAGEVAAEVEPFDFLVRGLSAVPADGQLRMIWAGIDEPTGRLAKLNELAEHAFVELGFKMEIRSFKPHMTLGRVKGGENVRELRAAAAELADEEFGLQPADELIVFSSELTGDGPVYSPLATVAVGG